MPRSHFPSGLRAVLGAVLAVGCTLGQATRADSRDFLWKVSGATGAVYLVGSVHLLNKDFYPLSDGFEKAFKESDLLVEEGAHADPSQKVRRGVAGPGQSLDKVVSPSTFDLVSKRVARLGMPVEPLKRFKPWLLALTLAALEWQKAGFDAGLGFE